MFIRSLVGLDREAAKAAFAGFLADKNLSADQIEFVDMIIDHLTERGALAPALLHEPPFTDLYTLGAKGILGDAGTAKVIQILRGIRQRDAA